MSEADHTKQEIFAKTMADRTAMKKRHGGRNDGRREYRLPTVPPRVWDSRRTIEIDPPYTRLSIDRYEDVADGQLGSGYQRNEIKPWVNDLSDVLRRGGQCPPIEAVKRAWEPGNTLWIVDGQQRYLASWDAQKPISVNVYVVEDRSEEIALFMIFNDRRRVPSNLLACNHDGPSFDIIKNAAESSGHPLHGRIHFREGGCGQRISVTSLIAATARYCGVTRTANMRAALAGIDRFVQSSAKNRAATEDFLRVVGSVFAKPIRPNNEMLMSLARVLNGCTVQLSSGHLTKMRKTRLAQVKAETSKERMLLMAKRLERAIYGEITQE